MVKYYCLSINKEDYKKLEEETKGIMKWLNLFSYTLVGNELNNDDNILIGYEDNDIGRTYIIILGILLDKKHNIHNNIIYRVVDDESLSVIRMPAPLPEQLIKELNLIKEYILSGRYRDRTLKGIFWDIYNIFVENKEIISDLKKSYILSNLKTKEIEELYYLLVECGSEDCKELALEKYGAELLPVQYESIENIVDRIMNLIKITIYREPYIKITAGRYLTLILKNKQLFVLSDKKKKNKESENKKIKRFLTPDLVGRILPSIIGEYSTERGIPEDEIDILTAQLDEIAMLLEKKIIAKIYEKITKGDISIFKNPSEEEVVLTFVNLLLSLNPTSIIKIGKGYGVSDVIRKVSGSKASRLIYLHEGNNGEIVEIEIPSYFFSRKILSYKVLSFLTNYTSVKERYHKYEIEKKEGNKEWRVIRTFIIDWNKLTSIFPRLKKIEKIAINIEDFLKEHEKEEKLKNEDEPPQVSSNFEDLLSKGEQQ